MIPRDNYYDWPIAVGSDPNDQGDVPRDANLDGIPDDLVGPRGLRGLQGIPGVQGDPGAVGLWVAPVREPREKAIKGSVAKKGTKATKVSPASKVIPVLKATRAPRVPRSKGRSRCPWCGRLNLDTDNDGHADWIEVTVEQIRMMKTVPRPTPMTTV